MNERTEALRKFLNQEPIETEQELSSLKQVLAASYFLADKSEQESEQIQEATLEEYNKQLKEAIVAAVENSIRIRG